MKSKFKKKIHECRVPLYGIYIYYSTDKDAISDMFDVKIKNSNGCTTWDDDSITVGMFIPHYDYLVSVPTLAHEAFHAAMRIGNFVGLDVDTQYNNEEIAYLITWICKWIYECLDKDKKLMLFNKSIKKKKSIKESQ